MFKGSLESNTQFTDQQVDYLYAKAFGGRAQGQETSNSVLALRALSPSSPPKIMYIDYLLIRLQLQNKPVYFGFGGEFAKAGGYL